MPDLKFGPHDIETLFFISKSDDHNRVDYGLRLDPSCQPVGDAPVFPYWREFEGAPPVRTHSLKFFEHAAYGVAGLKSVRLAEKSAEISLRLRALARQLVISTGLGPDGRCQAVVRTSIDGVEGAELVSAYVKLKGVLSVDYVEIYGRHPVSGADLSERIKP